MKIGIVAEGPSDIAVLLNIIKGMLDLDSRHVLAIRPELAADETDLNAPEHKGSYRAQQESEYSNWLLVLKECEARSRIEEFVESQIDECRIVVIQIDTAESHLVGFDIKRPSDRKSETYTDELRSLVVEKINGLLGAALAPHVRHAIAVEETDAWVLTIHDPDDRSTSSRLKAKERLQHLLARNKGKRRSALKGHAHAGTTGQRKVAARSVQAQYDELTRDFRKRAKLMACAARNRSLMLFVESL